MSLALGERLQIALAPPRYLDLPLAGIDVSTSGVKAARLAKRAHGLILAAYAEVQIPSGAFVDGEIAKASVITDAIKTAARKAGITAANAALPDSKSYLFETVGQGRTRQEWRTAAEQHLDELVPLPPEETTFDVVPAGHAEGGEVRLAGIGFARRVVDDTLAAYDGARISLNALEGETFAMARALLTPDDHSTTLIIDVGKSTTKLAIVEDHVPRFATTIAIGGHQLTLAVQKHFGVTELEARRVKAQRGIVPSPGNEDYLAAMLSTVSAIKDEIAKHLEYWQGRQALSDAHHPVTKAILAGGNASVRGFAEYLEGALRVPVTTGDVFTNLAPRDTWLPNLDYDESLAYATAIGLALRDAHIPS